MVLFIYSSPPALPNKGERGAGVCASWVERFRSLGVEFVGQAKTKGFRS